MWNHSTHQRPQSIMNQARTFELTESASEHDLNIVARELTRALDEINDKSNTYRAYGENVGWRDTNGEKQVELTDGQDLIRKLTPDTPCNLEFNISDTEITVEMTHHDSPMGETHTITAPKK